jgi:hypothetical protein
LFPVDPAFFFAQTTKNTTMTNTNDSNLFKNIILEDKDRYFFPVSGAPKKRGFKLSD